MVIEKLQKLKEDVYKANIDLVKSKLVFQTFGNVSGILRENGIVVIKPSGVDYNKLSPENMVPIDLDGNILEGSLKPSSDTKTHIELYKAFKDIGGIVHTHSRYATAWAQAKLPILCLGTTHADYFFGEVPCTEVISNKQIKKDYEKETGTLIINTFKSINYRHIKAVLVACHGPFTWGKDPEESVHVSILLEEIARINYISILLNPSLKSIDNELLKKHYLRKHGDHSYYGQ